MCPAKISSIESQIVSLPFKTGGPVPSIGGKPWTKLDVLLVRVETDDGTVGWGEAFGYASAVVVRTALDAVVAPLVVGKSLDGLASLQRDVLHAVHLLGRNGPYVHAFSGIEIALWDIVGKQANQPLAQVLGGGARRTLDAYASMLSYHDVESVKRNVESALKLGYRHIKIHEVRDDTVEAGANAAASAKLMVDVNCAWSVPVAQSMADSFRRHDLYWLEEPVWPPEDVRGLAQVRDRGVPIAAGENTAGLFGFKALIEAGAIDIAQPSLPKVGGIGETLRVLTLCESSGVKVALHSPYIGPAFAATLHVTSALVEEPLVEVLWVELEANPFPSWPATGDGTVDVPTNAGLGCDPDLEIVERYRSGSVVRIT